MEIQANSNTTDVIPVTRTFGDKDRLISNESRLIFEWITDCTCQAIALFGTVTNIINMICFVKQGFKDPVNVTLFGLAISDLGCLVTMIWINICILPAFKEADVPFNVEDMIYLGAGWPHVIFSRVTSFLTAFITLERCLCIAMPLKVISIFTPKRVMIVVISFFVLLIGSISPIYYVNRFAMVFVPSRNKTILGMVQSENRMDVITVSLLINNVIIPFGAFSIIIVCTAILVVSLHKKTKWRQSAASGNADNLLSRDQKVSKMILIISTMFIICFIPAVVSCLAMTIEPKIEMYGPYSNTFIVLFGISFLLETANSSSNIFVYYTMSSKFRATFKNIFGRQRDVDKIK